MRPSRGDFSRSVGAGCRGCRRSRRSSNSSGSIDNLNKALKALGATDLDYDGHREKAIVHVADAIHHLETASGRGKSNALIQQAEAGKTAAATKTASTPQDASDASLRKAKAILFVVHHELADHPASKGQIHADASIRVAITEIVSALNPPKATATAPAAASPAATSPTTTRPAR